MELKDLLDQIRTWTQKNGGSMNGIVNGWVCVPVYFYGDGTVGISCHRHGLEMEIRRKENDNPVIMVNEDGSILRYHGEFSHVRDHLSNLINP